jgi:hypothetical protein
VSCFCVEKLMIWRSEVMRLSPAELCRREGVETCTVEEEEERGEV